MEVVEAHLCIFETGWSGKCAQGGLAEGLYSTHSFVGSLGASILDPTTSYNGFRRCSG